MKYRQVTQASRPYKYGEGEEFLTKETAMKKIENLEQEIKTELAIQKIYDKSEVRIVEVPNVLQIVINIKIPVLVEEEI